MQRNLDEGRSRKIDIRLSWVKAHAGNLGNEEADKLAKEASRGSTTLLPLPPSYLKKKLNIKLLHEWQGEWDTSETGRETYSYQPKVCSRFFCTTPEVNAILTGHGPFPYYLHRFKKLSSPLCACGEEVTASHYLFICPLTSSWHLVTRTAENVQAWTEGILKNRSLQSKIKSLFHWLTENIELIAHPS